MSFITLVSDRVVENGIDVAHGYTEEAGCPGTSLVRVVGILVHICELGFLGYDITVFLAVELATDERATATIIS